MLVEVAAKLYNRLAKDLVEEILSSYTVSTTRRPSSPSLPFSDEQNFPTNPSESHSCEGDHSDVERKDI
jgi:hypothetical protein